MIRLLLLGAMLAVFLTAQTDSVDKWSTLNRICGRVVRDVSPNKSSEQLKSISGAIVQLYDWNENRACCDVPALVESKTEHSGEFEFKNARAGTYWLLVNVKARKYAIKVGYEPNYSSDFGSCSDHLFIIKQSGDFILEKYIHVD
jgi:hypothetical protein